MRYGCRIWGVFFLVMTAAGFACDWARGDADGAAAPEVILQRAVTVTNAAGRNFRGELLGFREERLLLRAREGRGDVTYTFAPDDIRRIRFPGTEVELAAREHFREERFADALPYLDALYRQRAPYLEVAGAENRRPLFLLPRAALETGDPYRAIGVARRLIDFASGDEERELREVILLAYYRLDLREDAKEMAETLTREEDLYPRSALGWWILAEEAYRAEDYARAYWVALQPVVFSGHLALPYLNRCYAVAVASVHRMEEDGRAFVLFAEMKERGLSWPENGIYSEIGREYREVWERKRREAEREREEDVDPEMDRRPPREDLDLPLQAVRKLLPRERNR